MLTQNVIIFIICSLILAALFFLEVYTQDYIKLEIVWYYMDEDLMYDLKYHPDVTFVRFNVYDKALENIIKEKEKEEEIKKKYQRSIRNAQYVVHIWMDINILYVDMSIK